MGRSTDSCPRAVMIHLAGDDRNSCTRPKHPVAALWRALAIGGGPNAPSRELVTRPDRTERLSPHAYADDLAALGADEEVLVQRERLDLAPMNILEFLSAVRTKRIVISLR